GWALVAGKKRVPRPAAGMTAVVTVRGVCTALFYCAAGCSPAWEGRYVLTPEIFEMLERIEPGSGGELQLTDAIALLLQSQAVYGYTFTEGRYDTGQVLDYLKVIVELASERDDLGPEFRTFLADFVRQRDL
ncbi:MAG TPA: UTP--glucose-1-phosphate uridylyltransferase, partial [Iamia sp.]